jgi:tetrahydromethanopterin S-methyltransferase subunit F
MMETELITVSLRDMQNLYVLVGGILGIAIGSLFTFLLMMIKESH